MKKFKCGNCEHIMDSVQNYCNSCGVQLSDTDDKDDINLPPAHQAILDAIISALKYRGKNWPKIENKGDAWTATLYYTNTPVIDASVAKKLTTIGGKWSMEIDRKGAGSGTITVQF